MTTTLIPSSESTVSTFSRTCDRLLQQLLQNAEASLLFDARARDQAENNLERFRIWGNNIAAFKTPRSTASLEYRLRDAPQVLDRFKSRLQELIDSSTQACAIVAGDQPNREDSSTQILDGQAPRTTELEELFLTLQSSIDGLFRLSMAIRERRPQGKLPARKPVSADADLYLPRDRNHITDKYPKTKHSPWLVERLVNSIAKRRAYILDRQRHMEGLKIPVNYERDNQSVIDRERALSTIATTFEDPAVAPPPPPEHLEGHKVRRSSMAWSTVTTLATRPGPHGDEEFYVPDLSNLVFNGVQLQYDEIFECPFCRGIKEIGNYVDWSRHIFSDLRPYACTFDDCNVEDFESRREWFEHELRVHRREWYCLKCSDTTFHTKAQLADHFKAAHQDMTDRQVSIILEASSKPRRYFDESSCPFHESWQQAPNTHLTPDPNDNRKDFARHLAHDLRQLALSAIQLSWVNGLELREDGEAPEGSADDELEENLEAVDNGEDFGDKLFSAISAGDEDVVKELILMPGTDVNRKNRSGWTALSSAVAHGNKAVVRLLLDKGANTNAADKDGRTPLHWASMSGHVEVVKLLLDKGADTNAANKIGWRPLSWASMSGHVEVVKLLLDKGADINAAGCTPLHWASARGHVEVVKLLLDKGADINAADKDGWRPLSCASMSGHVEVVKLLLDKGADINAAGCTPLSWASTRGHVEVVKLLLDKGADTNAADKDGRTPLHQASMSGHVEVVKLLLDKGADINAADKDGYTSLHRASASGYIEVVELLLNKGADINAADKDGYTSFHRASASEHVEVVKLLLNKGADINAVNKDGHTPLSWASEKKHVEVVKLLSGSD